MACSLPWALPMATLLLLAVCGNILVEAVVAAPLTKLDGHCYCSQSQHLSNNETTPGYIKTDVYVGSQKQIHCCASEMLPPDVKDFKNVSVYWSFNGSPYKWSIVDSQFRDRGCFPQQLEATSVVTSDGGNYTCEYHLPGGRTFARTTLLVVHEKSTADPVIVNMTDVVVARQGETVSIPCRAYTGSGMFHFGPESVQWWAYDEDGMDVPARRVVGALVENGPGSGKGMYTSTLTIPSVTSAHYGVYTCTASNENSSVMRTVTLQFGVDVVVAKMERYQTMTILLTVGGLVFCLLVSFMYRNKLRIALLCRQYSTHEAVGDFKSDVFIIHGESSVDWVMTELLPQLETVHGYTCYLPFRDLEGGDALVDALPRELQRSRRVLLVVTHCLLDSPWSLWCIEQALHSVLTHRLKMAAVLLQDIRDLEKTPQAARLLSRISVTKKIRHPSFVSAKQKKEANKTPSLGCGSKIAYPTLQVNSTDVEELEEEEHLVLTETIRSDFESQRKATQRAQFRHEGFVLGGNMTHPKSDNCLDKMAIETTENLCSKAKSDLYLNLTVPDSNLCTKSNSLQNQRLVNMISSTQHLAVDPPSKERDGRQLNGQPSQSMPGTWQEAQQEQKLKRNPHFFGEDVNQNTDDQYLSLSIKRNPHFFNEETKSGQKETDQTSACQVKFADLPNGRSSGVDADLKGSQYMECVRPYKAKNMHHHVAESIEPDSPCSVTPFILPSKEKEKDLARIRHQKQTVLGSVVLCVVAFFTRRPEEHFWQRLLLQLPAEPLARQGQAQV